MKKIIILLISVFFTICYSSLPGNAEYKRKNLEPKILLTSDQLEKCGFVRIDGSNFRLYQLEDGFILGNIKDNTIIRYKSPRDIRQYQQRGAGPGEFLYANRIFKYDCHTIGIHDFRKKSVLLFDLDLNYQKEFKVDTKIERISALKGENRYIAFGFFKKKVFAILDRDFKIKETFFPAVTKSRLPRMYLSMLNSGHFLNENRFAFTRQYYTEKICTVDIYNVDTRKVILTLKWEHDRRNTEKDRLKLENLYISSQIMEYDGYYVILNYFTKKVKAPLVHDFIIFDKEGNIRYRDKNFPYDIIFITNTPKSRLYLITEDEDLAFIQFSDFVKQ